jgi:hypothetical protein
MCQYFPQSLDAMERHYDLPIERRHIVVSVLNIKKDIPHNPIQSCVIIKLIIFSTSRFFCQLVFILVLS